MIVRRVRRAPDLHYQARLERELYGEIVSPSLQQLPPPNPGFVRQCNYRAADRSRCAWPRHTGNVHNVQLAPVSPTRPSPTAAVR